MLQKQPVRSLRRLFSTLVVALPLAIPAQATWSIVVLDTATGEVIVAGATCLPGLYLPGPIACIAVGKGGGASQSFVLHQAKGIMFTGFHADKTPAEIFTEIQQGYGPLGQRQLGIVGMAGPPVSHTGNANGAAALGVVGEVGTLRYSIQGNVLAQDEVIYAAEQALLNSEGDLGQRVMIAMEVATEKGGDGRCSCQGPPPCGQPAEFRRASATAFIILSRLGDIDSPTCVVTNNNCSNGDYYGLISEIGDFTTPDPVGILRRKYEFWREGLVARADHYNTDVYQTAQVLKADGVDSSTLDIVLRDVNGRPLVTGGQNIVVTVEDGPPATIASVTDNGDGTHTVVVTSGTQVGTTKLRIVVQDGVRDVQLHPGVELVQAPPTELFANQHTVSASLGGVVEFSIDSPTNAGAPYHLLGSASGTVPGTPFGGLILPLNRDRLMGFTFLAANGQALPNSQGALDAAGQATALLVAAPDYLGSLVGSHCDFVVFQAASGPSAARVTNLVGFEVAP